ncbi:hypothetical protein EDB87DRAFT_1573344 [Lactarius vividus]|nr:hypothetical protein EDB87DRAFT_1573344 [Lactarius vividus]
MTTCGVGATRTEKGQKWRWEAVGVDVGLALAGSVGRTTRLGQSPRRSAEPEARAIMDFPSQAWGICTDRIVVLTGLTPCPDLVPICPGPIYDLVPPSPSTILSAELQPCKPSKGPQELLVSYALASCFSLADVNKSTRRISIFYTSGCSSPSFGFARCRPFQGSGTSYFRTRRLPRPSPPSRVRRPQRHLITKEGPCQHESQIPTIAAKAAMRTEGGSGKRQKESLSRTSVPHRLQIRGHATEKVITGARTHTTVANLDSNRIPKIRQTRDEVPTLKTKPGRCGLVIQDMCLVPAHTRIYGIKKFALIQSHHRRMHRRFAVDSRQIMLTLGFDRIMRRHALDIAMRGSNLAIGEVSEPQPVVKDANECQEDIYGTCK